MADVNYQAPAPNIARPKSSRQLRRLQPVSHGHYADLSCIYASINALRFSLELSRPLALGDCEQLFRFAVRHLERCGQLASMLERGVANAEWPILVRGIADRAEDFAGVRIGLAQPFSHSGVSFQEVIDAVRSAIDARKAILIRLAGRYGHYTVIAGYSRTRFRLFDGCGYSWLNLAACDVASDAAAVRHQLDPSSMVALGLAPAQHLDLLKDSS